MRFPPELREAVLLSAMTNRGVCITVDEEDPLIYPDNMTVRLHRWLYASVRGEIGPTEFLVRVCSTKGCVSPWHREKRHPRPPRTHCPNNHAYDPATDLPGRLRCAVCAAARLERRRRLYDPLAAIAPAERTHCPQEHRLSPDNVYLWIDGKGRRHRKCRMCTIERSRAARMSVAAETV